MLGITATRRTKWGKSFGWDQHNDRAPGAWYAADEMFALEFDDHSVNAGWRDAKKALHIQLGWCLPMDHRVSVDEGEVVALGFCPRVQDGSIGQAGLGELDWDGCAASVVRDYATRCV